MATVGVMRLSAPFLADEKYCREHAAVKTAVEAALRELGIVVPSVVKMEVLILGAREVLEKIASQVNGSGKLPFELKVRSDYGLLRGGSDWHSLEPVGEIEEIVKLL